MSGPIAMVNPLGLWFGTGYGRRLPEGWTLVERENEVALAVDKAGQWYYLGEYRAYPRRCRKTGIWAPWWVKDAGFYLDDVHGVVELGGEWTARDEEEYLKLMRQPGGGK